MSFQVHEQFVAVPQLRRRLRRPRGKLSNPRPCSGLVMWETPRPELAAQALPSGSRTARHLSLLLMVLSKRWHLARGPAPSSKTKVAQAGGSGCNWFGRRRGLSGAPACVAIFYVLWRVGVCVSWLPFEMLFYACVRRCCHGLRGSSFASDGKRGTLPVSFARLRAKSSRQSGASVL